MWHIVGAMEVLAVTGSAKSRDILGVFRLRLRQLHVIYLLFMFSQHSAWYFKAADVVCDIIHYIFYWQVP